MGITVINNPQEININNGWLKYTTVSTKGHLVDEQGNRVDRTYAGPKFRLLAQKEHTFSCLERTGRGLLGVMLVVCTLGLALISKPVRELFTKQKSIIRYAVNEEVKNVIIVQSLWQRKKATRIDQRVKEFFQKKIQTNAAIAIQKGFRRHKEGNPSPYSLICQRALAPDSQMPSKKLRKTTVFFPEEDPKIILKKSQGREFAIRRLEKMQEVRRILKSQKSSYLVVPTAHLFKQFLIEDRLPIDVDKYHNMGLYVEHASLFDAPVREMVRLFSKGCLCDLFTSGISFVPDVLSSVRYDNLPFYMVEQDGKIEARIGLIDLEHFALNRQSTASNNLRILARIFPYHLALIKEEAHLLKMEIDEKLDQELGRCSDIGETVLKAEYIGHRDFLRKKGASQSVREPFVLNPQTRKEVTQAIQTELLKLNSGVNDTYKRKKISNQPSKDILVGNPEEVANELAGIIAKSILDKLKNEIESYQKENFNDFVRKEEAESTLVRFRSPMLQGESVCREVHQLLSNSPKIKIIKQSDGEIGYITEQLFYVALEALEKGGNIYTFDLGAHCFDDFNIRY